MHAIICNIMTRKASQSLAAGVAAAGRALEPKRIRARTAEEIEDDGAAVQRS